MAKRPIAESAAESDGHQAYLKRKKVQHHAVSAEDVHSSEQLQQLLAFDQDVGRARHGIQSLKTFLEGFIPESDSRRVAILRKYLYSQQPHDLEDKEATYLGDVMQTWSFASQMNNESLLSGVASVLALLMKILSKILEFSDYGRGIGRTLLQKPQLELLARGMTVIKSKEYIISPCVRLLREVTIFDGGALAKQVFRARDHTMKFLARNMGLRSYPDIMEDRIRASVRTQSIRYVLALMKFLPAEQRRELLSLRDVIPALTRELKSDPPHLISEILGTVKSHVLQDENIPRDVKVKVINGYSLGRIAALYGCDEFIDDALDAKLTVEDVVHSFLQIACTSRTSGILQDSSGFYPKGVDPNETIDGDLHGGSIDLGLDNVDWSDKFTDDMPVRNSILSEFLQTLRPWSSLKQSELLVMVLKAAPELVADYFHKKKNFAFDPKPTAVWMGYSAFLFSTIQLPVPPFLGYRGAYARLPPPTAVVLESILPRPLEQKIMTRCLTQKDQLTKFFAIRILIIAFDKLSSVLERYQEAAQTVSKIWEQGERRILDEFCRRCPPMKDIITAFKTIPDTEPLQREAIARLLVKYYETIPQLALETKFDVSPFLAAALKNLEAAETESENQAVLLKEVECLFRLANFSPDMRWFVKNQNISKTPFMAMLDIISSKKTNFATLQLENIADSVMKESGVLQVRTSRSSLDALIIAVRESRDIGASEPVYSFLDDCVSRCASTPIKYIDISDQVYKDAYYKNGEDTKPLDSIVSLLAMAIMEQWPFVVKSIDEAEQLNTANFVANYFALAIKTGEDKHIFKKIIKQMKKETPQDSECVRILEGYKKLTSTVVVPKARVKVQKIASLSENAKDSSKSQEIEILSEMTVNLPELDPAALHRWVSKEVEEIVEEGRLSSLVLLLSSEHLEIRKEAVTNISKFNAKLKTSTYTDKDQVWLLLSELLESAKSCVDDRPLPSTISSFASNAIAVLRDPLHRLYPKMNKHLSRKPVWDIDKFPLMSAILDDEPSHDDGHYTEVEWMLKYMLEGLRTAEDLAIFHKRRVFERLLSIYQNPYMKKFTREQILKILLRATSIEGGSTTLITRFSCLSWVEAQMACNDDMVFRLLKDRLLETCDGTRVEKWSGRSIAELAR